MDKLKIAVLVSGRGSNLQAILDHISHGKLAAQVVLVLSDQQECPALNRGQAAGIPVKALSPAGYACRESYDAALADLVAQSGAQLVVLAGFMRLLGPVFLERFPQRVIKMCIRDRPIPGRRTSPQSGQGSGRRERRCG